MAGCRWLVDSIINSSILLHIHLLIHPSTNSVFSSVSLLIIVIMMMIIMVMPMMMLMVTMCRNCNYKSV